MGFRLGQCIFGSGGFTADESYFLHFIIHTIFTELKAQTSLDRTKFDAWTRQRHKQIENSELIYIAKQIDVLARITY